MIQPTASILPEYARLLPQMRVTNFGLINPIAARLVSQVKAGRYGSVPEKTSIPLLFIAPSFEREASSDFSRSPAQGDRWNMPSKNVPKNRGPFSSWPAAALDAYHLNGLDKVGSTNWTWTLICYYAELFNGFGYRDYHRMRSPYLWGGTNLQQLGKYTSDGKFDAGHFDSQPGVIPLAMRMAQLDQSLAMTDPWPFAIGPAVPIPAAVPVQTPIASFDVFKVQRDLKKKGFDPGLVDGSFGRKTSVAVRAFEAANGLVADGLLDAMTVTALAA